ncbi:MAG TPA: magnesium transporter [Acidimicrobiales bacterium]|nr:magnesium transporter [Acidimicrobiales bacterium]
MFGRRRDLWAGFAALTLSCLGDLITGLTLGSITGTLQRLPGLLVLVPAAIGMRGNVFGALGSRISTLAHQGRFHAVRSVESPTGQNIAAAVVLSATTSTALAVLAKVLSAALGVRHSIALADFIVVSVLGAALSSVVLLAVTLFMARRSVRHNVDLDNISAPVVTTTGDVVTLPSLFAATFLVRRPWVTPIVSWLCVAVTIVALLWLLRRPALGIARRIVVESTPVLMLAATVDVVSGVAIERRLSSFLALPALLVLIPPFLEESGALGGILSARLATKLHLGIIDTRPRSWSGARDDIAVVLFYAAPVYIFLGVVASVASGVTGIVSPGIFGLIAVSVLGGAMATAAAIAIAFATAIATFRLGLDPDSHGIPLVTSSLDLIGVGCLLAAAGLLRFG